ncbi:hypothetical protein SNE26_11455 [Mucilaginibacter sp. cycad4]|uniref:hypothetical protein n=1 Tax=Mucilaginibacter sp. cycad4 TaxID=3342096 RepID=UPI002AAB9330|nr:hypothetical protein [Mucilaginibacter gossypii]WPV02393.1 hypothetical protein SNE26_11455 [Mucilaginibacter gossypii]
MLFSLAFQTNAQNKSNVKPLPPPVDVYICGFKLDGHSAAYLKNGMLVNIGDKESIVNAMTVVDDHVYATGMAHGAAVYWKDGQEVVLTGFPNHGEGFAITVFKNDVYVAGYERVSKDPNMFAGWTDEARLWKNGTKIPMVVSKGFHSGASCLAVDPSSGDVYVGGVDNNKTRYWKNGDLKQLNDQNKPVHPADLLISKNQMYVVGTTLSNTVPDYWQAAYWNNTQGTMVLSSQTPMEAKATAIVITGNDVYVAGYAGEKVVYWKNGIMTELADLPGFPEKYALAVAGADVYVMGRDKNGAKLWVNGKATVIANLWPMDMVAVLRGKNAQKPAATSAVVKTEPGAVVPALSPKQEADRILERNRYMPEITTTASGLQYQVLRKGTGPTPTASDKVNFSYHRTILVGKKNQGTSELIVAENRKVGELFPGLAEGLQLMPAGSRYQFIIPYHLNKFSVTPEYPAGAVITILEIELLAVLK